MIFPIARSSLDGEGPIALFRLMSLYLGLSRQNNFGGALGGVVAARSGLQSVSFMALQFRSHSHIEQAIGPGCIAQFILSSPIK
jgi:hypothetical protein